MSKDVICREDNVAVKENNLRRRRCTNHHCDRYYWNGTGLTAQPQVTVLIHHQLLCVFVGASAHVCVCVRTKVYLARHHGIKCKKMQ